MWDFFEKLVNGNNGIWVLIVVALIAVFACWLIASNKLRIRTLHVTVGVTEQEIRALLMKESQFVKNYCESGQKELIAREKLRGFDMDEKNTELVFEKVLDDLSEWLLVNHVNDSPVYVADKIEQIKLTVRKNIGHVNSEIRTNEQFMRDMDEYCAEFTQNVISGIVRIRDNFNAELKKKQFQ